MFCYLFKTMVKVTFGIFKGVGRAYGSPYGYYQEDDYIHPLDRAMYNL
jgi:hypothetical protein